MTNTHPVWWVVKCNEKKTEFAIKSLGILKILAFSENILFGRGVE